MSASAPGHVVVNEAGELYAGFSSELNAPIWRKRKTIDCVLGEEIASKVVSQLSQLGYNVTVQGEEFVATRIYALKRTGSTTIVALVRATTRSTALAYMASKTWVAEQPTPDEVIAATVAGIKVEDSTASTVVAAPPVSSTATIMAAALAMLEPK